MATETFDTFNEIYETTRDSSAKLIKAAQSCAEEIAAEQEELRVSLLEAAQAKASRLAASKDFQSFVATQAELGQECAQQVLKASQSCAAIVASYSKACQGMFEAGLKTANSNFGAPVSKGKRKA
jgi:Phasin protein